MERRRKPRAIPHYEDKGREEEEHCPSTAFLFVYPETIKEELGQLSNRTVAPHNPGGDKAYGKTVSKHPLHRRTGGGGRQNTRPGLGRAGGEEQSADQVNRLWPRVTLKKKKKTRPVGKEAPIAEGGMIGPIFAQKKKKKRRWLKIEVLEETGLRPPWRNGFVYNVADHWWVFGRRYRGRGGKWGNEGSALESN